MRYFISSVFVLMLAAIVGSVDTSANIPPSPPIAQPVMPVITIVLPVLTIEKQPRDKDLFIIDSVNYGIVQRECLALNIYHEAKNQSQNGQLAVGFVTLNRVASSRYPNTICEVVKQSKMNNGKIILNKCQFSWWCDGKSDIPKNRNAWITAQTIAYTLLIDYKRRDYDITNGSLWYHATYVNPKWTTNLIQTAQLEDHIFYRLP